MWNSAFWWYMKTLLFRASTKNPTRGGWELLENFRENPTPLKIHRLEHLSVLQRDHRNSPRSPRRSSSWCHRDWEWIRLMSRMRWFALFVNFYYHSHKWRLSSENPRGCLRGSNSKMLSENLFCRLLFTRSTLAQGATSASYRLDYEVLGKTTWEKHAQIGIDWKEAEWHASVSVPPMQHMRSVMPCHVKNSP